MSIPRAQARRDELLRLFARPRAHRRPIEWLLGYPSARHLPTLRTASRPSAPWGGLTATHAPEPRDIYWENLARDGSRAQFVAQIITQLVTVLMVTGGVILCVVVQSVEGIITNDIPEADLQTGRAALNSDFHIYGAQVATRPPA